MDQKQIDREKAVRKQKGYQQFAETLKWLESPDTTVEMIFTRLHPEHKVLWSQREARTLY